MEQGEVSSPFGQETMKFRRIYWVTEHVQPDGGSQVIGVYTSIPDLIDKGMRWAPGEEGFRVSLVKLDHEGEPFGCWSSPGFAGMEADLQEFVKTGEFSGPETEALAMALREFASGSVRS
jgi:hypothetical protein